MTENALITTPGPRKLWVRALLMLLMCAAFQLAAWVLVLTDRKSTRLNSSHRP